MTRQFARKLAQNKEKGNRLDRNQIELPTSLFPTAVDLLSQQFRSTS
jgi:hypothetical protein